MTAYDSKRASELLAIVSKATPGPWSADVCAGLWSAGHTAAIRDGKISAREGLQAMMSGQAHNDGLVIATLPDLADQLRAAMAEIERLERECDLYRLRYSRIDIIGQNGGDGIHYIAGDAQDGGE